MAIVGGLFCLRQPATERGGLSVPKHRIILCRRQRGQRYLQTGPHFSRDIHAEIGCKNTKNYRLPQSIHG